MYCFNVCLLVNSHYYNKSFFDTSDSFFGNFLIELFIIITYTFIYTWQKHQANIQYAEMLQTNELTVIALRCKNEC